MSDTVLSFLGNGCLRDLVKDATSWELAQLGEKTPGFFSVSYALILQ